MCGSLNGNVILDSKSANRKNFMIMQSMQIIIITTTTTIPMIITVANTTKSPDYEELCGL
jgi:hypothetical protein